MKLEHRKQKVASVHRFLYRQLWYALVAFFLIGISVGAGVLGYRILAGLNWVDSFYMACMILTGMGPTVTMTSNTAKIFSSCYALYSGVAFLSIAAVFFAPIVHRLLHILHVEDTEEKS